MPIAPPARASRPGTLKSWLKAADRYTLWAFNPQPQLARTRRTAG